MKQVINYGLTSLLVVILALSCGYAGMKYQEKKELELAGREETVTMIAVVNLDEGIKQDNQVINYGQSLIDTSVNGFTNVGLEDARKGTENGIYAAYILIPATFSESVVSLNDTPQKALIQYKVNPKLREDIREEVLYKVYHFENELNNNLEYLFVSAILEEFHQAQDNASVVLANDQMDIDVLLAISPMDLVSSIDIGELERVENNIEYVDLTGDYELNRQLVASIRQKYDEYILAGQPQLQEFYIKSGEVTGDSGVTEMLGEMGIFLNEDGTKVYQEGVDNIQTILSDHNQGLADQKAVLNEQVVAIADNVLRVKEQVSEYEGEVSQYQHQVGEYLRQAGIYTEQVDDYTTQVEAYDEVVSVYEEGVNEYVGGAKSYQQSVNIYSTQTSEAIAKYGEELEELQGSVELQFKQMIGAELVSGDDGYETSIKGKVTNFMATFKEYTADNLYVLIEQQIRTIITDGLSNTLEPALNQLLTAQMDELAATEGMVEYTQAEVVDQMGQELLINSKIVSYLEVMSITELKEATDSNPSHELNILVSQLCYYSFGSFSEYYDAKISGAYNGFDNPVATFTQGLERVTVSDLMDTYVLSGLNTGDEDYLTMVGGVVTQVVSEGFASLSETQKDSVLEGIFEGAINEHGVTYDNFDLGLMDLALVFDFETGFEDSISLPSEFNTDLSVEIGTEVVNGIVPIEATVEDVVQTVINDDIPVVVDVDQIGDVNQGQVKEVVNGSVISKMTLKTGEENVILGELYTRKQQDLDQLHQEFLRADPLSEVNGSEISSINSAILESVSNMQSKLTDNNSAYRDYSSQVYSATQENVNQLTNNIRITNEESKTHIETVMEKAKISRYTSSSSNQSLMESFISKLSYTRLGNGPYAGAYEFIVNPTYLEGVAENFKNSSDQQNVVDRSFQIDAQLIVNVGLIMVALILVGVLVKRNNGSIGRREKKLQRQ